MLIGIIKSYNNYEYIFYIDNKIKSIHIDKNGVKDSDISYIQNIFSKLLLNKECIYLEKYGDYEVYYDKKNKFKHFIKNGIEDYKKFYELNGHDAILYINNDKEKINDKKKVKEFTLSFAGTIISLTLLLESFIGICQIMTNKQDNPNFNIDTTITTIYSRSELRKLYDLGPLDYEGAIDYIYASNIPNEIKDYLSNQELLQRIFLYYKDSPLEFTANMKFKNLDIKYENLKMGLNGYYSHIQPNIIHLNDDLDGKINENDYLRETMAHEFIHLLQAEGNPYNYLKEASAELLAHEFFDTNIITYKPAVNNLRLLTEIIGPEPIMQLLFAGDSFQFNNILKSNLEEKDYVKLITYFQNSDIIYDHEEENKEIKNILCNLYQNIYGQDITKDTNILYKLFYESDELINNGKYYFNYSKMPDIDEFDLTRSSINPEKLTNYNIVITNDKAIYAKEITYEEYINSQEKYIPENETYLLRLKDDTKTYLLEKTENNDRLLHIYDKDDESEIQIIPLEEAVKSNLVYFEARKTIDISNGNQVELGEEWTQIEVIQKKVIQSLSIKNRFIDQTTPIIEQQRNQQPTRIHRA